MNTVSEHRMAKRRRFSPAVYRVAQQFCPIRVRRKLFEQFHHLGSSGMREPEMLAMIWRLRTRNGSTNRLHPAALFCEDALHALEQEGRTLPEVAMLWAGKIEQPLLVAGAATGASPELYRDIVEHLDNSIELRRALMGLAANILILIAIIAGTEVFLAYQFVPAVSGFVELGQLRGSARSLVYSALFFRDGWPVIALTSAGIAVGMTFSLPRFTGPLRDRLDAFEPYLTYRHISGGTFLCAAAALFSAGLSEREIFTLLRSHATPYLAERIRRLERIEAVFGTRIHRQPDNWPDMESAIESAFAAEHPDPVAAYARAGARLIRRSIQRCQRLAEIGSWLASFILAAVIVWILIATNDISASFRLAHDQLP